MIGCVVAAACVLVPASAGAGTARPAVSLVASPPQVTLAGTARQRIRVTNSGSGSLVVDVTRAGFALDLRGRPRIVPRGRGASGAASWLAVRPRRVVLEPGGEATLTVAATLPPRAEPGDHDALVLLTTRPLRRAGVAIRMRIGIVVVVRAPGKIVRRLELRRLRVRPLRRARLLELVVANRGNVTEVLLRGCLGVSLRRAGRELARLRPVPRRLLPRTVGIAEFRYGGTVRGWVSARVEVSGGKRCGRALRRTFRIRL